QPCQPYVTPSSISSFGRRLSSAHIAERKSVKNSGENTICQSSARSRTHKILKYSAIMRDVRLFPSSSTKADIPGGPPRVDFVAKVG
ncbi:hypothetical protein, partial [Bradyrhizobium yuanmingense]|uniref:hypothetical protein n=1 Tax=Bradyrhizobium yuanmingense TaxID=108015 RepID=UPI001AEDD0D2